MVGHGVYILFIIALDKVILFNQTVLIFFLFLYENICCGIHLKCLTEALLVSTHNICFHFTSVLKKSMDLSLKNSKMLF